jgi:hypothetical protein
VAQVFCPISPRTFLNKYIRVTPFNHAPRNVYWRRGIFLSLPLKTVVYLGGTWSKCRYILYFLRAWSFVRDHLNNWCLFFFRRRLKLRTKLRNAYEMSIYHKTQFDKVSSRIISLLGYKQTFCHSVVSTECPCFYIFVKT